MNSKLISVIELNENGTCNICLYLDIPGKGWEKRVYIKRDEKHPLGSDAAELLILLTLGGVRLRKRDADGKWAY